MNPNGSASTTISQVVKSVQTGFQVNLTLNRHPKFYILNVFTPIFVHTVVGQSVFAIPEHADSKILVPLTVLLGFMFVQGIIANEMPPTEQTPYVAIYAVSCILLYGMSCLASAFCMWVAHLVRPLTKWLKCIWVDGVGFILFQSLVSPLCPPL